MCRLSQFVLSLYCNYQTGVASCVRSRCSPRGATASHGRWRARRRRAAARCLTEVLPADVLGLVLYQLRSPTTSRAVAPTCHALDDAAKLAFKARPFSGEVVTLAGHNNWVIGVATAPDGRVITGSARQHRHGVARRRVRAHHPGAHRRDHGGGGAAGRSALRQRLDDKTAKLWTLDGALERTFAVGSYVLCVAALPDGVHFVVGLCSNEVRAVPRRRDARPHLQGAHGHGVRGGGDARRPAHHQRLVRQGVKVWSVASRAS